MSAALDDAPASTEENLELLTEHFGFNPKAWIDKLVDAANQQLYELAENVEGAVVGLLDERHPTKREDNALAAEKGMHKLLTLFEHRLDQMYDTFELWSLVHVFGITPRQAAFVTLDHQRGLDLRPLPRPDTDGATSRALARHYELTREERALRARIKHVRPISTRRRPRTLADRWSDAQLKETGVMLDDARAAQEARRALLERQMKDVAFLFKGDAPRVDRTTSAMLRKVRGDAHDLLRLAQSLAQLAPLTAKLAVPEATLLPVRPPDTEDLPPPALGNRDAYLEWEVRRALAALPREGAGVPHRPHGEPAQVEALAKRL